MSLNTTLDATVNFSCEATGTTFIYFIVGQVPASESSIANQGFTELNQQAINGNIRRLLSVQARCMNNNTYIYCSAVTSSGNIRSDNATLTIQGIVLYQFNCVIIHFFRSIG